MVQPQRPSRARPLDSLLDSVAAVLDDDGPALALVGEFLQRASYSRDFALSLVGRARHGSGLRWETRRLAVLMLENHLLKLLPEAFEDWDVILTQLHLKASAGAESAVRGSVLKEGFSTTEPRGFVAELRRRLARLNWVHDRVGGKDTSRDALLDFIRLSRCECKLTLARYLFTPEEVVGRILVQVRTSKGIVDLNPFAPPYVADEAAHAMTARLPDFEAAIARRLCETAQIYWVSEATDSEINAMVEYPLTTVVLVVKPPGSDIELEIKRAGRRGPHPLGVVYRRGNGDAVPPSHRLDGGSTTEGLRYEARSASRLSRVFRLVHGREAPIPQYLSCASIQYVAARDAQASTLDYFSDPHVFGAGFREMRGAMDESVLAFGREHGANLLEMPGVMGRTLQFLSYVTPGQAILAETSSFRLDRLAAYLSADGAEVYFTEGLKVEYSPPDAKHLADELLEEVLGVYCPPRVPYRDHDQYLASAFRVAENRERADQSYLSVLEQVGRFWGILFAIRGHSMGESFVARNVGLRSVWDGGRWQVRVIFMDHDNLQTNEITPGEFQAVGILKSLSADDVFIWGGADDDSRSNNEMRCLKTIYRVSAGVVAEGKHRFRDSARDAYRRTHAALEREPGLRPLFHESFLGRVRDWDAVIAHYLRVRGKAGGVGAWRKATRATLTRKGYEAELVKAMLLAVEMHGDFLAKYDYLFEQP
jgi:hypothetical protein